MKAQNQKAYRYEEIRESSATGGREEAPAQTREHGRKTA
jgi:hypothetical protein